jgi:hypothetical protein
MQGTKQLEYLVENMLFEAHYKGSVGRRRLARQIVEAVVENYQPEKIMRNKQWDLAHDFPADLAPIVEKLERALGLRNMMRDERAQEIYRWLIEQEAAGKTIKTFAEWALQPERAQFVGKYKKTPEAIKTDWSFAFSIAETKKGGYDEVRF